MGSVAGVGQGPQRADQHGVEPGSGWRSWAIWSVTSSRAMPSGTRDEVLADAPEGVDHLDLVDDVEVAAPLPQQQVHVGQRLKAGPELARGPPHPLGDGPHLAVALGHEDDDAVGLAEAVGAQDDARVAEEAHVPGALVARRWRG